MRWLEKAEGVGQGLLMVFGVGIGGGHKDMIEHLALDMARERGTV